MAATYALVVKLESYEFGGEFYLLGDRYETPREVFEHVATDHLLRIQQAEAIEDYLLDVLNEGANAGKDEYEAADPAVECWIHVDVYHRSYSFWTGDHVVEIEGEPTAEKLESIAGNL